MLDTKSVYKWCDDIDAVVKNDLNQNTYGIDPRRVVFAPVLAYSIRLLRAVAKELDETRKLLEASKQNSSS